MDFTLVEDVDEEGLDVGLRDELPARVRELGHEASEGKNASALINLKYSK